MILNYQDWTKARAIIRKHKSRIDFLSRRFANPRAEYAATAEIGRLEKRISELSDQLQRYERLLKKTETVATPASLLDIPECLIARRIRSGLTQQEFAHLIGINGRCFARYEATLYAGASYRRIVQIDAALRQCEKTPPGTCGRHQSSRDSSS